MERKYKITSANMIVPMVVRFCKEDEFFTVSIGVNYAQDEIIFNSEKIADIDYDDLAQEILAYLRPESPPTPNIPADVLEKVTKVRSGKYQEAFNQPPIPEVTI